VDEAIYITVPNGNEMDYIHKLVFNDEYVMIKIKPTIFDDLYSYASLTAFSYDDYPYIEI